MITQAEQWIITGTGACLLYGISRVVIAENKNFVGGEAYLRSRGVEVVVLNDKECTALMDKFIEEKPDLWYAANLALCTQKTPDTNISLIIRIIGTRTLVLKKGSGQRKARRRTRARSIHKHVRDKEVRQASTS